MRNYFMIIILILSVSAIASGQVQDKETIKENIMLATESVTDWLELVDTANYAESWETASDLFRNAVAKNNWILTITGVREPLGHVLSRKIISKKYHTKLPGVAEGEYVVIICKTVFENYAEAPETITMMNDSDNWRLAGYFIK